MGYYRAFHELYKVLPRDCIYVSEGANTMDIGRTIIANHLPRSRLDAGTFGTMGVGLGFAIAAAMVHPNRRVVCVEGDSAFGFSGMELETACRYKLPIVFIIINNNGIYGGLDGDSWAGLTGEGQQAHQLSQELPVNALLPEARYEKMAEGTEVGVCACIPFTMALDSLWRKELFCHDAGRVPRGRCPGACRQYDVPRQLPHLALRIAQASGTDSLFCFKAVQETNDKIGTWLADAQGCRRAPVSKKKNGTRDHHSLFGEKHTRKENIKRQTSTKRTHKLH